MLEGSESVVLKCKVDETVPIEWYKDNQAITEKFPKYTFIQAGLRIKPVAKSDAGTYYCKAGTLRSKKATLTVECKFACIHEPLCATQGFALPNNTSKYGQAFFNN